MRRRWDNDYPLWKTFAVPTGTYSLKVLLDGMDEPLEVGEGIVVAQGEVVDFDSGL